MFKAILKRLFENLRHSSAAYLTTVSVLVASYTILTVAILFQQNIEQYLTQWGKEIKLNVYLTDQIKDDEISQVEAYLKSTETFTRVEYLTKSQAAEKFKSKLSQYAPGLLSDIEFDNPLPASFEMTLAGGLKSSGQFDYVIEIVNKLKQMNGIDDVSYGQGWVENYASVLRVFSLTSYFFMLVMLTGSLFVIGNSVRNSLIQRLDEISVLELFGATRSAIIGPFIVEGLVMGFISSVVAVFSAYIIYLWQIDLMARDLAFWNVQANIHFLNLSRITLILVLGTALGGLGSYLWIRKVATGWSAAEASHK